VNREKSITINGKRFSLEAGETVLEVAQRNGIDIPTLCYIKGSMPTGACRICMVEVKGARNLLPACATPATHTYYEGAKSTIPV
jgi:NADH dehydrogenase/NADH:ubiquinone oxidoreductase subunit G